MRSIVTLAEDHVEEDGECRWCSSTWPCSVGVALAEIDRLRARVAELEAAIRTVQREHWTLRAGNVSCCHTCGACPCATRLELDAVLPPEEQQG